MIDKIADLYRKTSNVNGKEVGWKKNIYTIFGTNSTIVSPVIKDNKKAYKDLLKTFLSYLDNNNEPLCSCCGKNNSIPEKKKEIIYRHLFPLVSTGYNFASVGNKGFRVCPICIIMVQLAPLVMMKMGDKISLIHSSNTKILLDFAKQCKTHYDYNISSGNFSGCIDKGFYNSKNALIYLTTKLIQDYIAEDDERIISLRIYTFNNYQNSSDLDTIEFYDLPSNVFHFLSIMKDKGKLKFFRGFIRNNHYELKKQNDSEGKSKKKKEISEEEKERKIKNSYNPVIDNLINNKSIIKYFIDYKNKKPRLEWEIVEIYLKEVLEMEQNRIDAIKNLGDKLADIIKKENLKKILGNIEGAKNYSTMLNQLRLVWRKHIAKGEKEPLIRFDDFIYMTFSENLYNLWRETRELLIFRIFEVLQPTGWLLESGYIKETEDIIKKVSESESDSNN